MLSEFAKEKIFWTRKMNLKLVYFIKRRPYLWNPNHANYTTGPQRDKTYAIFAKSCGDEFPESAVKERWTNIRSSFANYLRKVRSAEAKGETYKVNWHLWEPCQFLLDASKSKPNNNSEEIDDSKEENNSDLEPDGTEYDSESPEEEANNDCKLVAESLLNVFQQYQNDAFGCGNTDNDEVGRMVSKKLSAMEAKDAGVLSVKIMEILRNYECED